MPVDADREAAELYLDLLKKTLTRFAFGEFNAQVAEPGRGRSPLARAKRFAYSTSRRLLASRGLELMRRVEFDAELRASGTDWPGDAETMIGTRALDHLQRCIVDVLEKDVPGDLIETGVWRGGAAIFMRGVLKAYGVEDRTVWAADSFQGLPEPDPRFPADQGDKMWTQSMYSVSLEDVKKNFERYRLLDGKVRFLEGWFKDTLPAAPIERLAILRLDGDMYESTMDALTALHHKVSVGGYVIIDDYGITGLGCRQAVDDFRAKNGIEDELKHADGPRVYWRRD